MNALEVFFVETADYVLLEDLEEFLRKMAADERDFLALDLLKVLVNEQQIELSGIDSRIVMDRRGRLVTPETCILDLKEGLPEGERPVEFDQLDRLCPGH
jgi:hypothetical protein